MSVTPLNEAAFVGVGRILLIGTFGIALAMSLQEDDELDTPFLRLVIGFLALIFFVSGLSTVQRLGEELASFCGKLGPKESLKDFVVQSLARAGIVDSSQGFRDTLGQAKAYATQATNLLNQIVRTGVWGVVASIAEFFFLLVGLVLECAREVLWKILILFFPIGCGVYPVFPKILHNLTLYAVEIALWFPLLKLIDAVTSIVARQYTIKEDSVGLYIVAVEIVAIALILFIPSLAHRCVHAALSSDLGVGSSVTGHVKRYILWR